MIELLWEFHLYSLKMLNLANLLFLIVCSISIVVGREQSNLTHDEVLNQLRPYRGSIQHFILESVIGGSGKVDNEDELICGACKVGLTIALGFIEQGTYDEILESLVNICNELDLDLLHADVCSGLAEGFFPSLYTIMTERQPALTVDDVCGFIFQRPSDVTPCGVVNEDFTNWVINVDPNKPANIPKPPLPDNIETAKILHLTDIHPDLAYAENSSTACGKPMCCRATVPAQNDSVAAGYFGDYTCDIPISGMDDAFLDAAKRYNDYKFIILGGDYVHHGIWLTTKEDIINHINVVADSVHSAFPDTQIYPIVGNHESFPTNVFAPKYMWEVKPEFDVSWVYGTLADLYEHQLTEEAAASLRHAGYYTQLVEAGLRVVVLNTNFCYNLNFWIMFDPVDPEGQLQWFSDQMKMAEDAGEKVFVLGHHPIGDGDCWSHWNKQFNTVVIRYQSIIAGIFYGHTHNDDFKIFFDGENPSTAAFISPSITAYTYINPGYKVFHYDGVRESPTWEIVDYEAFSYNLTEANVPNSKPDWYKLYSAKEAFGLESLRPQDLYDLVLRMAKDNSLFQEFFRFFHKDSHVHETCDDPVCIRGMLCSLITADYADRSRCSVLDTIIKV